MSILPRMKWFPCFLLVGLFAFLPSLVAADRLSGTFGLEAGEKYTGEVIDFDKEGVVMKLSAGPRSGQFTRRTPWEEFDQEALKTFTRDPQMKRFSQFLVKIENLTEEQVRDIFEGLTDPPKKVITMGTVTPPDRPFANAGLFGAMLGSLGGWVLIGLVVVGSAFAGMEVGLYNNWPKFLALGIGAVPVVGPVILFFVPAPRFRPKPVEEEIIEEEELEDEEEEEEEVVEAPPVEPVKQVPPTKYFKRGEVNLNRRFIENKFAGFFRVIPSDEDKDFYLVMKTARGTWAGRRIMKITATELIFQEAKENGTVDHEVPLNDILEIAVRHQDATD